MRFPPLLLVGLLGTASGAAGPAPKAPPAPGPGEPLRRLCAAWQEGASPLLEAPFRAPALRYRDGALAMDLSQAASVEDGPRGLVEILPAEPDEALAQVAVADGARLVRAQATGQLEARIAFYPARGPLLPTPCLALGGGRVLRVRVQPLWVSLWQGGKEQARLYTERGEGRGPEGRPEALFDIQGALFEGDGGDLEGLRAALRPLEGRAAACYEQALKRRADLAGKLILGADLDRDGRPSGARVEVDAIGDGELARCLRDLFAGARLGRLRRSGHFSVPLLLRHAPQR